MTKEPGCPQSDAMGGEQPTLTQDIAVWIEEHSHGDLYQNIHDLRGAMLTASGEHIKLEKRVATLEQSLQELCLAMDYEQLIEPRGPHD